MQQQSQHLAPTSPTSLRRMVLCDFWWTRDKDPRVPLGHASLLSALHAANVAVTPVRIAVNTGLVSPDRVATQVLDAAGGCDSSVDIAIGAYVWAEVLLQKVLPLLRRRGFAGRIILGGPQISYSPAGIAAMYPDADVFVRGYGEAALVQLACSLGKPPIPGVHYRGEPELCDQAEVDLRTLPSPFLNGVIPLSRQKFVRWETQRGCPFRCAFCQHREAGAQLKRRDLEQQRILAEIDLFCRSGVDDIAVLDPIFNANPHATAVLQRFVDNGYRGKLALQCRAEMTTPAFLAAAAPLHVNLEFGLQTVHDHESRAIGRANNIAKVDIALRDVRKLGLRHEVSLIFGLPQQSLASFEQSVSWCLERRVPVVKAFPLLLLRGTPLAQNRDQWGLRDDGSAMAKVLSSNSFTHDEWLKMARLSEALSATEGSHPASLAELRLLAGDIEPRQERWMPLAA